MKAHKYLSPRRKVRKDRQAIVRKHTFTWIFLVILYVEKKYSNNNLAVLARENLIYAFGEILVAATHAPAICALKMLSVSYFPLSDNRTSKN